MSARSSEKEATGEAARTDTDAHPAADGNIFLSYRRDDSADVVGRILDRLNASLDDREIFRDVDDIPLGVDFKKYIDAAIADAAMLLVAIGPRWTSAASAEGKRRLEDPDDFVRLEVEAALAREIPVIPLLVGGADMPGVDDLPQTMRPLAFRNGIPIRPDPDFDNDVGRLLKGLERFTTDTRFREVMDLEAQATAAESTGDWAAAVAALSRLGELDPERRGLAARHAGVEAKVAASEGRWPDVLSAIARIRAEGPDWRDSDDLEATARAHLTVIEARRIADAGNPKAARTRIAVLADRDAALPGVAALVAEIDRALRARRRRISWAGMTAAAIVAVLAGALLVVTGIIGSGESFAQVRVPSVEGEASSTAEEVIAEAGLFALAADREHSDTVPEGHVISQNPAPDRELEAGSEVYLVVSLGAEDGTDALDEPPTDQPSATVPLVEGADVATATNAIEDAGLEARTEDEHSDAVGEGRVISQDPAAGDEAEAGSEVVLVVSLGSEDGSADPDPAPTPAPPPPAPAIVPSVEEMPLATAAAAIEDAGLRTVRTEGEHSETVAEGHVISQDPAAGHEVEAGSDVGLIVSLGSSLPEVPDFVGDTEAAASAWGDEHGIEVSTETQTHDSVPEGLVIDQKPVVGTRSATATIVVSDGPGLSCAAGSIESGFRGLVAERRADGTLGGNIADVEVTFSREDGMISCSAVTNGSGRYEQPLPPGRYVVTATHDGYEDFSSAPGFYVVPDDGQAHTGNVFLTPRDREPDPIFPVPTVALDLWRMQASEN